MRNLTPWIPELYSLSGFSFLFHEWGLALLFRARNNIGYCVLCALIWISEQRKSCMSPNFEVNTWLFYMTHFYQRKFVIGGYGPQIQTRPPSVQIRTRLIIELFIFPFIELHRKSLVESVCVLHSKHICPYPSAQCKPQAKCLTKLFALSQRKGHSKIFWRAAVQAVADWLMS